MIKFPTLLASAALASTPMTLRAAEQAKPNDQMQAVLDKLASLGGKPITSLSPKEARMQPSPADAVKAILKENGSERPEKVGNVENVSIDLGDREIKARVYQPEGNGPFPIILYIHGGGWVIADLDTYDSSPRALVNGTGAMVISIHYRQAPEYPFPAAHEDSDDAYRWILENGGKWKGDTKNVAVVGESAGGNLAASVCMMAHKEGIQEPVYQVLVYPIADTKTDTLSYKENADAKPLSADLMKWFLKYTFATPADANDPRVALLRADSFKGLPSATVITAQIDPLRSEGKELAEKLKAAGVDVDYKNYDGVTHEFFGMAAVVDEAKEANALASANLKKAFSKNGTKHETE